MMDLYAEWRSGVKDPFPKHTGAIDCSRCSLRRFTVDAASFKRVSMDLEHYMSKALAEAEKALAAGEFPVGCVVVCDHHILATGSRTGTRQGQPNEIDHAEMVALRRLARMTPTPDLRRAVLLSTLEPCLMCYGAILLSGIRRIVFAYEDVMGGATACDLTLLPPLYRLSPMDITADIRREESLALFKTYFSDPRNDYWKDSFLASYTLAQ